MNKYVEWMQPYGDGAETVIMRMSFSDIAAYQRRHEPRYKSDEEAVEDFVVVNYATVIDEPAIAKLHEGLLKVFSELATGIEHLGTEMEDYEKAAFPALELDRQAALKKEKPE